MVAGSVACVLPVGEGGQLYSGWVGHKGGLEDYSWGCDRSLIFLAEVCGGAR